MIGCYCWYTPATFFWYQFNAAIATCHLCIKSPMTSQFSFQWLNRNLISSFLCSPLERNNSHCFITWHPMIFLNVRLPVCLWYISELLIELLWQTSNTISILEEWELEETINVCSWSANSVKVRPEFFIFCIIVIPSIKVATGAGVTSTQVGSFSNSWSRLIFLFWPILLCLFSKTMELAQVGSKIVVWDQVFVSFWW